MLIDELLCVLGMRPLRPESSGQISSTGVRCRRTRDLVAKPPIIQRNEIQRDQLNDRLGTGMFGCSEKLIN